MNYKAATAAMIAFFAAQVPGIAVAYPDVPFTPPDDQPWIRLTIQHADGYQASAGSPGSNRYRRVGLATAQVFQPEGQGSKPAREMADQIIQSFIGVVNGDIHYFDVQMREIGNDGAGWYQVNVLIYFRYDHIA